MPLGWGWRKLLASSLSSPWLSGDVCVPCHYLGKSQRCQLRFSRIVLRRCIGASDPEFWFETSADSTIVTLLTPPLEFVPEVQPIVTLPALVDGLVSLKMSSGCASYISATTYYTFLRTMTIWAVFFFPSADSHWRSSMLSLTERDFHWAQ